MHRLTPSAELAWRIPDRIMSLSLVVTRAGGNLWVNMPSVFGTHICLGIN